MRPWRAHVASSWGQGGDGVIAASEARRRSGSCVAHRIAALALSIRGRAVLTSVAPVLVGRDLGRSRCHLAAGWPRGDWRQNQWRLVAGLVRQHQQFAAGQEVGRSHQLLRRCDHDDFTDLLISVALSQGQFSVDPAWEHGFFVAWASGRSAGAGAIDDGDPGEGNDPAAGSCGHGDLRRHVAEARRIGTIKRSLGSRLSAPPDFRFDVS